LIIPHVWLFDASIMNRRKFLATLGGASAAAVTAESSLKADSTTDTTNQNGAIATARLMDGTPAVYAPTATGATIVWTLNTPARGVVEYGESADLGQVYRSDAFGFVPNGERFIKVKLRGLKPGVRYWWRTVTVLLSGGDPEISPVYSFRTLDPAAAETKFAVWNDTHDRAETIRKLHSFTKSEPADFLIWNGDASNNIEKPGVIPGLYVHPAGVNLSEGPPVLFSRGNHDCRGLYASQVPDYIDYPAGRPYYAFRSGPLAVIVLDTGEDKPDKHPTFRGVAAFEPLIQAEKQWLARVIQRPEIRNAPYRLMFCHIPLRSSMEMPVDYDKGGYDLFSKRGREAWNESLVRWGVQAVISGHMHQAACLKGTPEFPYDQLVGGGPDLAGATVIRGFATNKEMKITIQALDGATRHAVSYQPRSA
jgi:hypothetical protein